MTCRYPAAIAGFVGGVWAAALDPNAKVSCSRHVTCHVKRLMWHLGFAEAFHHKPHQLGFFALAAAVIVPITPVPAAIMFITHSNHHNLRCDHQHHQHITATSHLLLHSYGDLSLVSAQPFVNMYTPATCVTRHPL